MKEVMNVHRALAELKTIGARIERATYDSVFCVANKHSSDKIDGISIDEFKERMKSDKQKVLDLIKRRNAIKRAVVNSNAVTKVAISGKEYTVAEAIDMKTTGMELNQVLIRKLKTQYKEALRLIAENSGDNLERRAERYIEAIISAQPREAKSTVNSDAMKAMRAEYIKNNSYDLIDPIGIEKLIKDMEEEYLSFTTEVDAALSVSNATTEIVVEY